MASLVIDTGVDTHPQISVDGVDFKNGLVNFRWVGAPYSGDCAEPFVISLADHGNLTLNQMVSVISAEMTALLQ